MMMGQIFEKIANGTPLTPQERQDFISFGNQLSLDSSKFNSLWTPDGSMKVGTLFADTIVPKNPISRIVNYYITQQVQSIASEQEVVLSFNGSVYGAGDNPLSQACVLQMPGYDNRFILNSNLVGTTPIRMFGEVSLSADIHYGCEVYVNFYYIATDEYLGAFSFSMPAVDSPYWRTPCWDLVSDFRDGQYVTISIWQNSGVGLTVQQLDANFALA